MNDFLNRLLEMQKTLKEHPNDKGMEYLSEDMIIAQGVIFVVAGFETTASTMATTCYHLSMSSSSGTTVYNSTCMSFQVVKYFLFAY